MSVALIHPMLVHFPIVLVLTALLFDAWRVVRGPDTRQGGGPDIGTILLVLAGIAAIVTFIFGDLAYDIAIDHGVAESVLESHEGWGTMTMFALVGIAVVRLVMWLRRWDGSTKARLFAAGLAAVGSVMVVVTAYFGGHLVYDLGVNVATMG